MTRVTLPAAAVLILLFSILAVPPALAQERPDYVVVDPTFEALDGATAFSGTQTVDGADSGYRIEVPDNWNGTLVLYAHGFVGPQNADLVVQDAPLRPLFIEQGFAWAASSYSANGYVIDNSIDETDALRENFAALTGMDAPTSTIIHGISMGGHITGAAIERRPEAYTGALPACGVMADAELFDYFADVNLVAGALSGVEVNVPEDLSFLGGDAQTISAALGLQTGLNTRGTQYAQIVEALSGGERPTFEESLEFWNVAAAVDPGEGPTIPFLQALFGRALSMGIEDPVVAGSYDNSATVYSFPDGNGAEMSPVEMALNAGVTRFDGSDAVPFPIIEGTPQIPVMSIHTTGDLFVPLFNQVTYAQEVADNNLSDNLVQRTVRAAGHCDFTATELGTAFGDLVAWIASGTRPEGEDLLDPAVIGNRDLGCQFTSETHLFMPECDEPAAVSLAGTDAVDASIAVSGARVAASSVVIARSDVFADGLAGSTLAGITGAPILLNGSASLDERVLAEIQRLGATEVVLLGGTAALAPAVQTALEDAGLTVSRVSGPDRFGTAAAVAAAVAEATGPVPMVYLASGRGFADSVAVSGLAAFLGVPVLLTEPTEMPAATAAALESLGNPAVTVIGGSAAVSDEVAGENPRLAGANRYGTSDAIVAASREAGLSINNPWVATGESFADALVAGPGSADAGQILVLVDGDDLAGSTDSTQATIGSLGSLVADLYVVSTNDAVSATSIASLLAEL